VALDLSIGASTSLSFKTFKTGLPVCKPLIVLQSGEIRTQVAVYSDSHSEVA